MDEPSRIVAAGYDRVAEAYADLEDETWPRLRRLEDALDRLRPGASVLDLGCGNGVPALGAIVARGHRAVGVDVSAVQAAAARRNVPAAQVVHADALTLDVEPRSFDLVTAFYVLDHVPRDRHAELLRRIRAWLADDGLLLVTFEGGEERDSVDPWLGVPMVFSHFDEDTNVGLVDAAGFETLDRDVEIQREGDADVPFLWILARASARPA